MTSDTQAIDALKTLVVELSTKTEFEENDLEALIGLGIAAIIEQDERFGVLIEEVSHIASSLSDLWDRVNLIEND